MDARLNTAARLDSTFAPTFRAPTSAPAQKPAALGFESVKDGFESLHAKHKPKPQPQPQPSPGPTPSPGPSSGLPHIPGRPPYVTEIDAVVTIDQYKGMQHGRNGDHEIAEGHITRILMIDNQKVIDTQKVHLAMNVKSAKDANGLPHEIPLKPGQQIEVEGEYIPAKNASGSNGSAVLHFTHSPLGYVVIDGQKYQ